MCCKLKKHNTKTYQELQERIIYIYRERERERERESNHIFSYGRGVQNKNSLPYSEDARKNYKPTKRKPKKKKKSMRERELSYFGVGNMD